MSKAQTTRLMILEKALELIYQNGYQATSIDDIIATTNVTKGAFYYHFKTKEDMGLAIIESLMYPTMRQAVISSLADVTDPQQGLYRMMEDVLTNEQFFDPEYGCPVVNMTMEMTPINDKFAVALRKIVNEWLTAIGKCLERGKKDGKVKESLDCEQAALHILTGYHGIRNLGKLFGKSCYDNYLKELKSYLLSIK